MVSGSGGALEGSLSSHEVSKTYQAPARVFPPELPLVRGAARERGGAEDPAALRHPSALGGPGGGAAAEAPGGPAAGRGPGEPAGGESRKRGQGGGVWRGGCVAARTPLQKV